MGFGALFYPWGMVLQALAIIHFVRRRPDAYWLWVILFLGGLGALVYIVVEVVPGRAAAAQFAAGRAAAAAGSGSSKRSFIENPAVGNLEELADLSLEDRRMCPRARAVRQESSSRAPVRRTRISPRHRGARVEGVTRPRGRTISSVSWR